MDGLEAELALLAKRHNLDPQGTVHYASSVNDVAKDVSTISGHRDLQQHHECPGGHLYSQLLAIRSNVASRIAGTAPVNSAVVSFNSGSQTVKENAGTVQLSVTRTGNTDVATLAPGSLDFTPGDTTKKISLSITDDGAHEDRGNIVVSLSNPGSGTVGTSPASDPGHHRTERPATGRMDQPD